MGSFALGGFALGRLLLLRAAPPAPRPADTRTCCARCGRTPDRCRCAPGAADRYQRRWYRATLSILGSAPPESPDEDWATGLRATLRDLLRGRAR